MTDEIMYEIMQLSGQEYSDMYAGKAKKLIAERRRLRPRAGQLPRRQVSQTRPRPRLTQTPRQSLLLVSVPGARARGQCGPVVANPVVLGFRAGSPAPDGVYLPLLAAVAQFWCVRRRRANDGGTARRVRPAQGAVGAP